MGRGFFNVTPELLREMFGISDDNAVVGADWDFHSNSLNVYAVGPLFPEALEGEVVQRVDLVLHRDAFGRVHAECGGSIGDRVDMSAPQFRDWLLSHEDDIVNEINDFGDLRDVFSAFIGREPVSKAA